MLCVRFHVYYVSLHIIYIMHIGICVLCRVTYKVGMLEMEEYRHDSVGLHI